MSQNNDGGPAFPHPVNKHEVGFQYKIVDGMTLRDYFAAQAPCPPYGWLQKVCNTEDPEDVGGLELAEKSAQWSFMYADAMLKEREVRP
jgi:hypothetical protein